jgi:prepilin-type N-terminal cleavage/methylation domain-containing protein/prepilin-type processing-associated H-X9-DG protein
MKRLTQKTKRQGAFTLIELLVVIAIIAILAAILLPVLRAAQVRAQSVYCMNNYRQMGIAWLMYINDNSDYLPDNCDRDGTASGNEKTQNWICPGLAGQVVPPLLDWSASANNFNTTLITYDQVAMGTHSVAQMSPYVSKQIKIFVCPADNYISPAQQSADAAIRAQYGISSRIRTCSMDGAMGGGPKWFQKGQGGASTMPAYYNVIKMSDMHWPGPADCWVVTDEHPDANDDCALFVNPADASTGNSGYDGEFTELPGSLHAKGADMFFADGHSEIHKWRGGVDTIPVQYITYTDAQGVKVAGDPGAAIDLTWWASHTPAN